MDAPADNICHVSKGDDKIPRFDGVRVEAVPNPGRCGGGGVWLALHGGSDWDPSAREEKRAPL